MVAAAAVPIPAGSPRLLATDHDRRAATVPESAAASMRQAAAPAGTSAPRRNAKARRSFWLRQLHTWHWMSSALCLVGMILFAATGITLNHAASIGASPDITTRTATLPDAHREALKAAADAEGPLPAAVTSWVAGQLSVDAAGATPDWSDDEVYLGLPRPGGDAWLRIELETGVATYEKTDRGWIAYLNDLHKGRHTGVVWSWFIDIFAVACLVFCATGLLLLQLHAGNRPATWPITGLGLVIPVALAILFIH